MGSVMRPSNYHHDAIVDLTLDVTSLIDAQPLMWNVERLRQYIAELDVDIISNTRIHRNIADSLI